MATYSDYYNKLKADADKQYADTSAANTAATEKYIADVKTSYDPAISSAKTNADTQTQGLNQQFQKDFDTQAIQELVNKRKLAESMANQGLSNSGLNRTQETALAVTRTNNEGAITQQKNTQARQIAQSLDDYLNGVNSTIAQASATAYANLSANNQSVYNSIYNALSENATSLANADTAAEAARYKAEQEAAAAAYKAQLEAQTAATKAAESAYGDYYARAKYLASSSEDGKVATYDYIAHTLVDGGALTQEQGERMMSELGIDPETYMNKAFAAKYSSSNGATTNTDIAKGNVYSSRDAYDSSVRSKYAARSSK